MIHEKNWKGTFDFLPSMMTNSVLLNSNRDVDLCQIMFVANNGVILAQSSLVVEPSQNSTKNVVIRKGCKS